MPYRRLPNTDSARLRALKAAYEKGRSVHVSKLAFSQETLLRIEVLLPDFEMAIGNFRTNQSMHLAKNKEYPSTLRKTKLYISHFIKVINMAIARGELRPDIRNFYGLSEYGSRIPDLNTESDLLEWGSRVISGETERTNMGLPPITNPNIALVKVWYEKFCDAHHYKSTHQKSSVRTLRAIASYRREADDIILNLWNEIESAFLDLSGDMMRELASTYGVVYVYRPHEQKRIKESESVPNLFSDLDSESGRYSEMPDKLVEGELKWTAGLNIQ